LLQSIQAASDADCLIIIALSGSKPLKRNLANSFDVDRFANHLAVNQKTKFFGT
jgi:hypothetical protein